MRQLSRSSQSFSCVKAAAWIAVCLLASFSAPARAQSDEASRILASVTDYVAAQKFITATIDTDVEVLTTALQKIKFTNSGEVSLARPDKFRARRHGGYSDVEVVFDGAVASILARHENVYTQQKAPVSFEQLVAHLRNEVGVAIPGADLLLTDARTILMTDVIQLDHIGRGVINGVQCHHIAARGREIDWQMWVEIGAAPIPRKFVITSKTVTAAPQYTLRVNSWSTEPPKDPSVFVFKAPADSKLVEFRDMREFDEVPAGVAGGSLK